MPINADELKALLAQVKALVEYLEGLEARTRAEETSAALGQYPPGRLTRRG